VGVGPEIATNFNMYNTNKCRFVRVKLSLIWCSWCSCYSVVSVHRVERTWWMRRDEAIMCPLLMHRYTLTTSTSHWPTGWHIRVNSRVTELGYRWDERLQSSRSLITTR